MFEGSMAFGGERGRASFLRKDGTVWTTDKMDFIWRYFGSGKSSVTEKDPQTIV